MHRPNFCESGSCPRTGLQEASGGAPGGLWALYLDEPVLVLCEYSKIPRSYWRFWEAALAKSGNNNSNSSGGTGPLNRKP